MPPVPEVFLVFVWVCGLLVNRSKQGLIHLFNMLGNIINFAKKCIHIKVWKLLFNLSILGILNFFCIYLLHFCPFHRTPPIWECFGNFLAHHKLDIKTFVRLKRRHQKWQLRMAVSHKWFQSFQVFFNLLNWYKTLCSVTGDPGQPMVHHSHPCHPSRQVSESFQLSFVSQS